MSLSQPLPVENTSSNIIDKDGAVMAPLVLNFTVSEDSQSCPPTTQSYDNLTSHKMPQPPDAHFAPIEPKRSVSFALEQENVRPDNSPPQQEQSIRAFDPFNDEQSKSGSFKSSTKLMRPPLYQQGKNSSNTKLKKSGTAAISELKKPVVPSSGYGKFGKIDFRADKLSMICKRWTKGGYWLHVYPAEVNLFESLEDMERWKGLKDCLENSNLELDTKTKRQMNQLVKKSINFDTTGALKQKMIKLEEKISGTRSSRKTKVVDVNSSSMPKSYIMEEVRSKHYNQNKTLMHTCKISYLGFNGRHISAAFGSTEPQQLKRIRAVIRSITKLVKKTTKKRSKKNPEINAANEAWISSTRSELTAISQTVYGKNTIHNLRRKQ